MNHNKFCNFIKYSYATNLQAQIFKLTTHKSPYYLSLHPPPTFLFPPALPHNIFPPFPPISDFPAFHFVLSITLRKRLCASVSDPTNNFKSIINVKRRDRHASAIRAGHPHRGLPRRVMEGPADRQRLRRHQRQVRDLRRHPILQELPGRHLPDHPRRQLRNQRRAREGRPERGDPREAQDQGQDRGKPVHAQHR
jgi:hypothetical protein